MHILDDSLPRTAADRNVKTDPELFLKIIAPYREDLVVAVECMFAWYWLSDLCSREKIPFILGHALYMKAIHGGKVKNDRIDANKIAVLLRGGMFPVAYVYPPKIRSTRDLLRRRMFLNRKRSALITHIKCTFAQYNLPEPEQNVSRVSQRDHPRTQDRPCGLLHPQTKDGVRTGDFLRMKRACPGKPVA